ncbi:MAG: molecular chaperone [Trebouxia sp. A1-2]|nr:MAG: molecular chaperone [Trebouxia sp. A1-2]
MTGVMLSGIRASPCIPLACGHRLRGRSLPMLQATRRNRTTGRSRQQHVVQAAAASFSPDDPYKVLGLHQGADSEAVQRQYNKLKREKRGDEEAITKIENAHSTAVVGGVGNVWKLNQVFPTSTSSTASEDEKKKGLKNILRGCLLAFLATFAGCFLFFTLPDLIASQLNKQLPYWFYANEKVLLCVGTTLCNFLMTAFFR